MTSVRKKKDQESCLCVLRCKGLRMNVRDTSMTCGISIRRVYSCLDHINKSMRDNLLDGLINDLIPSEYAASLALNNIIIENSMKIAEEVTDKRVSLEAYRLASQTQAANEKLLVESVAIGKAIQSQMLKIPTRDNIPKENLVNRLSAINEVSEA